MLLRNRPSRCSPRPLGEGPTSGTRRFRTVVTIRRRPIRAMYRFRRPTRLPRASGAAMASSGGGGGGASGAGHRGDPAGSRGNAATEIASTIDASAAPTNNNTIAFAASGNDPNINDPGDFGTGLPTSGGKGKGVSAASASSFLQQTTGTKSNYVTGAPDPGLLGPDATTVIDYNYGDTYFTFPAIPFNGVTASGTALTTTRGGSTLQGAEFQGEITYPTNLRRADLIR